MCTARRENNLQKVREEQQRERRRCLKFSNMRRPTLLVEWPSTACPTTRHANRTLFDAKELGGRAPQWRWVKKQARCWRTRMSENKRPSQAEQI